MPKQRLALSSKVAAVTQAAQALGPSDKYCLCHDYPKICPTFRIVPMIPASSCALQILPCTMLKQRENEAELFEQPSSTTALCGQSNPEESFKSTHVTKI